MKDKENLKVSLRETITYQPSISPCSNKTCWQWVSTNHLLWGDSRRPRGCARKGRGVLAVQGVISRFVYQSLSNAPWIREDESLTVAKSTGNPCNGNSGWAWGVVGQGWENRRANLRQWEYQLRAIRETLNFSSSFAEWETHLYGVIEGIN